MGLMAGQKARHKADPFRCRNVRQPDEAGVWRTCGDKSTEVLVHRNQDSAFLRRPGQDHGVARIGTPIDRLRHVVALIAQPARQLAAGASIDQEPQAGTTSIASSRSPAITACA